MSTRTALSVLLAAFLVGLVLRGLDSSNSTRADTPGDVDCSGTIDPFDALALLQLNADMVASVPCMGKADLNEDAPPYLL